MPPSRCTSTTRAIPPRIASRWRAQPTAVCMPSAWHGKTSPAGTTDSTRRLTGATPSPSSSPVPAATARHLESVVHPRCQDLLLLPSGRPPSSNRRCGSTGRRRWSSGPAARGLLDLDRRDGTRHVRAHDRRQCLDDDHELGCTAPVAALGHVDGDDDRHDAAVRLTSGTAVRRRRAAIRTRNRRAPGLRDRSGLSRRLDRVQPCGHGASAWTCGAPASCHR